MNRDALQRECLSALGYRLQTLARRETPQAPVQSGAATPHDRLRVAVARAARRPIDALPDDVDWEALRRQPQAKRALWLRLRGTRPRS